jgi:hypothetical protein
MNIKINQSDIEVHCESPHQQLTARLEAAMMPTLLNWHNPLAWRKCLCNNSCALQRPSICRGWKEEKVWGNAQDSPFPTLCCRLISGFPMDGEAKSYVVCECNMHDRLTCCTDACGLSRDQR